VCHHCAPHTVAARLGKQTERRRERREGRKHPHSIKSSDKKKAEEQRIRFGRSKDVVYCYNRDGVILKQTNGSVFSLIPSISGSFSLSLVIRCREQQKSKIPPPPHSSPPPARPPICRSTLAPNEHLSFRSPLAIPLRSNITTPLFRNFNPSECVRLHCSSFSVPW